MSGPTYRWDKNICITAYSESELTIYCGGIYNPDVEFILHMDASRYRQKDIDHAKAFVARYVPAALEIEPPRKDGRFIKYLKSKMARRAD